MLIRFGETYQAYQRQVPMFIPRPGQWRRFADASDGGTED